MLVKPLTCRVELHTVNSILIALLPNEASAELPSRGQVMAKGTLNGQEFAKVLEPDGRGGHWFRVDEALTLSSGCDAILEIVPSKDWPDPEVPSDLRRSLDRAEDEIKTLWSHITPMARWEWVRWINETNNPDTRKRRIDVSISKMRAGKRRPCCFNLSACTDPELSKSGRLIESA